MPAEESERELLEKLGTAEGEERIEALYRMSCHLWKKAPARAAELATEALELCGRTGCDRLEPKCLNSLGMANLEQGSGEEALEFLERSCGIYSELGDLKKVANLYNSMGLVHLESGELDEAIDLLHDALSIARTEDIPMVVKSTTGNLGSGESGGVREAPRGTQERAGRPGKLILNRDFPSHELLLGITPGHLLLRFGLVEPFPDVPFIVFIGPADEYLCP